MTFVRKNGGAMYTATVTYGVKYYEFFLDNWSNCSKKKKWGGNWSNCRQLGYISFFNSTSCPPHTCGFYAFEYMTRR